MGITKDETVDRTESGTYNEIKDKGIDEMATTRKKANGKTQHGGKREGAGRKPDLDSGALDKSICLRCNQAQKDALNEFIENAPFNKEREAKGLKKIDLATWLRELGLKHSGNEKLGLAAKLRAEAEAASSFV